MEKVALRKKRWIYVGLTTLAIYAFLPFGPEVNKFVRNIIPLKESIHLVAALIGVTLISIFYKKIQWKRKRWIVIVALIGVYAWLFQSLTIVAEKIHLFEYGILGVLIIRALEVDFQGWRKYVFAIVLFSTLGWGDEVIQFYLPNRYFEWRDVGLNVISGCLGLVWRVLWKK